MTTIDEREYWDRRAARFAAEDALEAELAESGAFRRDQLTRKLLSLQSDEGIGTPEAIAEVQAQIKAIEDAEEARFAAEWTPEVTAQRRATWNALVKSTLSKLSKTQLPAAVRAQERAQGWTTDSLKKAIKLNNL